VQDVDDLPGIVERPTADRIGQDLLRVVARELGAAEQSGQCGGAVLDGERDPLVSRQPTLVGELVEPAGSAAGRRELGCVGKQLARSALMTRATPAVTKLTAALQSRVEAFEQLGVQLARGKGAEHRPNVHTHQVLVPVTCGVLELRDLEPATDCLAERYVVFGWRFWSTWPCSLVSATSAAPYVFKVSRMYRGFLVSGSIPA